MGFWQQAPLAVPVQVRNGDRRVYRLSEEIGEAGVWLGQPAPFEVGEPVVARLVLPDAPQALELDAKVDGDGDSRWLKFSAVPPEARRKIQDYVRERLGLPAV